MTKAIRHYLDWDSEVSLTDVFDSGAAKHYPHRIGQNLLYLSSVPHSNLGKLRTVLCLHALNDENGAALDITPEPFDLQGDIHEYGGKPFWVFGNAVLFVNRTDRCLYRCYVFSQSMTPPERVSPIDVALRSPRCQSGDEQLPEPQHVAYGDVNLVNPNLAIAIAEIHSQETDEPTAIIVGIDLEHNDAPLIVLEYGADFYANLVLGSSGSDHRIAWVEWHHPNMPWDSNTFKTASLTTEQGECALKSVRSLPDIDSASYCQLVFGAQAQLFCVADFVTQSAQSSRNYWNVYQVDFSSLELEQLSAEQREFGYPHWQFGDCRLCVYLGRVVVGIAADPVADSLWIYDIETQEQRFMESKGTLQHLSINAQGLGAIIEMPVDGTPRIIVFSVMDDGHIETSAPNQEKTSVYQSAFSEQSKPQHKLPFEVSLAQHIEYSTSDNESAYAFYYPPANAKFDCRDAPPAIFMVHGGPTARAYGHFDLQKQFWTSNGFAVVDVNHRGSSGYGRLYRDALYGQWGELDCNDIVDAIDHLSERKLIDSRAVCIRGKSAGGYAVLRALTQHPDLFAAGASYYGIGDLATLAEITHKFEKHYTDRLLGEDYDSEQAQQVSSLYQTRSPITKLGGLKTPMAVFQGALDKVVPVKLAHDLVAALEAGGIDHQYYEYADEAHGFKNPKNNIAAWKAELAFYRSTLRSIMLN